MLQDWQPINRLVPTLMPDAKLVHFPRAFDQTTLSILSDPAHLPLLKMAGQCAVMGLLMLAGFISLYLDGVGAV